MDTINHLEMLLMNSNSDQKPKGSLYKSTNRFGRENDERPIASGNGPGNQPDRLIQQQFTPVKPTTIQSSVSPHQSSVSPLYSDILMSSFERSNDRKSYDQGNQPSFKEIQTKDNQPQ